MRPVNRMNSKHSVLRMAVLVVAAAALASGCAFVGLDGTGGSEDGDLEDSRAPTGKSKLSIHTADVGANTWTLNFVTEAQPTTIKLLGNNFSSAPQIKQLSPDTRTIGRAWRDNNADWEDLADEIADETPTEAAQRWWSEYSPIITNSTGDYNGVEAVDYWEGPNEPLVAAAPLGQTAMDWYGEFEAERVRILADHGKKAVIGNFSLGQPALPDGRPPEDGGSDEDPGVWPEFYPAIDAALANDGLLGLHEYATPMHKHFGEDSDHNYDIRDANQAMGWLVGRYRRVYYHYLKPTDRVIPLVITESGVDGFGGWQSVPYTEDEYKAQLVWFDKLMSEDEYVLGAQIFCVDMYGWEDFDLSPIMPWLTDYVGGDRSDLGNDELPPTVFAGTTITGSLNYLHDGAKLYSSTPANVYGWEPMKAINRAVYAGDMGTGWLSLPGESDTPELDPAFFFTELPQSAQVNEARVYPAGNYTQIAESEGFPQAFEVWVSNDTTTQWTTHAPTDADGNPMDVMDYDVLPSIAGDSDYDYDAMKAAIESFNEALDWGTDPVARWDYQDLFPNQYYTGMDPITLAFAPVEARYVKVKVLRRHPHGTSGTETWVKISEFAVYGP